MKVTTLTVTMPDFVDWDYQGAETARYGLAGISESGRGTELLLREIIKPEPVDLVRPATGGSITVQPRFTFGVYKRAQELGLPVVISLHTHAGGAFFSGIDRDSTRRHSAVARDFGLGYVQVVVGSDGLVASFLKDGKESEIDLVKVIKPRGIALVPTLNARPGSGEPDNVLDKAAFDRTLQIGGGIEEALKLLGSLRLAFVALGGIGAAVVQTLKFLNVKRFALVDPDVLDRSNANRYIGYRSGDEGTPKVKIIERELLAYDPGIEVQTFQECFPSPATVAALKGCDIIVSTPDNNWCRLRVAEFAAQHLKPVFDAGAGIYLSEEGEPFRVSSTTRMQLPPPLGPCLRCLGVRAEHPPQVEAVVEAARKSYIKGYRDSGPTPASVATLITHIGNQLARHILYYLSGVGGNEARIPTHFVSQEITLKSEDLSGLWSRKSECPVCGEHAQWGFGDAATRLVESPLPGSEDPIREESPGKAVVETETHKEVVWAE